MSATKALRPGVPTGHIVMGETWVLDTEDHGYPQSPNGDYISLDTELLITLDDGCLDVSLPAPDDSQLKPLVSIPLEALMAALIAQLPDGPDA